MGRPRKNVLNQKRKKAKVEPKEEVAKLLSPDIISVQPIGVSGETVFEMTQEDIEMDKYDMTVHSEINPPVVEEPKENVLEAKIIIGGNELVTKSIKEEKEPKIVFTNDPIEIEIPEKPLTRTLTGKEIRRFQRTGIMPK